MSFHLLFFLHIVIGWMVFSDVHDVRIFRGMVKSKRVSTLLA